MAMDCPIPVRPCPKTWSSPKTDASSVEVYVPSKAALWAPAQACGVPAWATSAGLWVGPAAAAGDCDSGAWVVPEAPAVARLEHGVLLEQAIETDHSGHHAVEGGRYLR